MHVNQTFSWLSQKNILRQNILSANYADLRDSYGVKFIMISFGQFLK